MLGSGGAFGCTQNDLSLPNAADEPVTAQKPALEPSLTPDALAPLAWYVASASDFGARAGDGTAVWTDRTGKHDATSGASASGRPELVADGWFGAPTLHFDGGSLLKVEAWSKPPADFSVLAVLRSAKAQDAAIAGFWDPNGGGYAWAALKNTNGLTLPDLTRTFGLAYGQTYTGPHDLGREPHVLAWRYASSTQTMELTVDGRTTTSTKLAPIGNLPAMPFIIGAKSLLPTGSFTGDISELVILDRALADAEVQGFSAYARRTWPHLPAQGSDDACISADGTASPEATRCDDGSAQTFGDHCAAGTCSGTPARAGSPAELATIAWYHAGVAEVALTDGGVSTWFDRTDHHLDLSQGFDAARPKLEARGWDSVDKPVLRFGGRHLLRRTALGDFSSAGNGNFTVYGVVRAKGSQSIALASFANSNGFGRATLRFEAKSERTTFAELRSADQRRAPDFLDGLSPELDASGHVVVWQYSPGAATLTLDGRTTAVNHVSSLGPFSPAEAVIGGASEFAPDYFKGDIAELALMAGTLSPSELDALSTYARDEWGGITLCSRACAGKARGDDDGCGSACAED